MITVGQPFPSFNIVGVKPGFNLPEEKGESAFEPLSEQSFPEKWKIVYFYPKDFTFVCPTEIVAFNDLVNDFADRDTVLLGGSPDNEFVKLAWRREHKDLNRLNHYSFADTGGQLASDLGILTADRLPLRATFIIDPHGVVQHVSVNNDSVGRNPNETLRILDALQTDELCPCNRQVGGETL